MSYKNSEPKPPIMVGSPPPPEWRVPRLDWDRPPWNRWAFQNINQILPTAPVSKGAGEYLQFEEEISEIDSIRFEDVSGKQSSVKQMVDDTYTDGFLILKDGKVIHESYYNGMQPDSLHLSQSVAKSITATVVGILIDKGLMDVQAPITQYLPELSQTGWNGATLQHLLDMTSGAKYSEEYTDRLSDIGVTDVACGWKPIPEGFEGEIDWPGCVWDQVLTLKEQDADHGSRFKYRSIETDVIAHAMERVTGKRLPQIFSDELWSKIGAERDALFTVDGSGYGLACGGFNATLRDYAKVGLLHLNNGFLNGQQIVSSEWINDIRNGNHGSFDDVGREAFPNGRYRNQFWIEDDNRETVMCFGVFGQLIYISPEYNLVAVKLSTWPEFLNFEFKVNTLRAIHAIAAALE